MTKEEIQKNSEHWYNKYKYAKKRIADLEKENREQKKLIEWLDMAINSDIPIADKLEELEKENAQLKEAKDLIKNIIRVTWGEGWNYSLDWKVKAEQFLSEVEK